MPKRNERERERLAALAARDRAFWDTPGCVPGRHGRGGPRATGRAGGRLLRGGHAAGAAGAVCERFQKAHAKAARGRVPGADAAGARLVARLRGAGGRGRYQHPRGDAAGLSGGVRPPSRSARRCDALGGLGLPAREHPLVHGDALSYSIAAASILAKVSRDRYMEEPGRAVPGLRLCAQQGLRHGGAHRPRCAPTAPARCTGARFIGRFV